MRTRYHFLDGLRGLAVINMIFYHFLFDFCVLEGFSPDWRAIPVIHLWQLFICWSFILISGFSCHLGRHPVRSGILVNVCGMIVTAVTLIAEPEEAIWFGILTFLGCSMLLTALLRPLLDRIPALSGAAVCLALHLLTLSVPVRLIAIGDTVLLRLPDALYQSNLFAVLGFSTADFYSSDYFPLIPWFFLYLVGFFIGKRFFSLSEKPEWTKRSVPVLSFIGRHSLLLYMIHQPVAMAAAMGIGAVLR